MMTNKHLTIFLVLILIMPMTIFGENYDSLWKKVQTAEDKDLPKTELEVLEQIVQKAQKQREYGQLMKAELKIAQVSCDISPDSLVPAVDRIKARAATVKDLPLKAVYNAVLGHIYSKNYELRNDDNQPDEYYRRAMASPQELARTKAGKYKPLVREGADSEIFGNDLLSLIGMWTNDYKTLHAYYDAAGNRRAACLTALEMLIANRPNGKKKLEESEYIVQLDSLIDRYQDVPEVGEVVLERYHYMNHFTDATAAQKMDYIHWSLERWGKWKRMGTLRNEELMLTDGQFRASLPKSIISTHEEQLLKLKDVRNLSQVTLNVYRVDADGQLSVNPNNSKDYNKKLKPLLRLQPELTQTLTYNGKKNYELTEDSLLMAPLPAGVYMLEVTSQPTTDVDRQLLYVSDVRLLSEALPENVTRFVAVDATTGHPIAGARLKVTVGYSNKYDSTRTVVLTTDADGEATFTAKGREYIKTVFAYTDTDKFNPLVSGTGRYYFTPSGNKEFITLYTDRSIYRPGQTVHVAAVVYSVSESIRQQAKAGESLAIELRDANFRVVEEHTVLTDDFGSGSCDFTLPKGVLTGNFTLRAGNARCSFRVEEYKRPTFEVELEKVKESYEPGDTVGVHGVARTYAGVPVQEGKVHYTVMRRRAWWWWRYSSYYETGLLGSSATEATVAEGDMVTGSDGRFTVDVPMIMPPSDTPQFFTFEVRADVTDVAGETHRGEISLSLGNRKTAFGCTLDKQILIDEEPKFSFTYYNASGFEVDSLVSYRIDEGEWQTVRTNTQLAIPRMVSGKHVLYACCGEDKLEREFTVFSLDDQRPATETDDWFYVSDARFPSDGRPVTLQVGSSASDVYIVYSLFSANSVIESGHVVKSGELINRKLTYKEEYGDAVLLTYAWVKDGQAYRHSATISRPLPNKELKLQWKTFRDRLTPGQQEEWTLTVMEPSGKKGAWVPARAQLMATLYDYSLDQLYGHDWNLTPQFLLSSPSTNWQFRTWSSLYFSGYRHSNREQVADLDFSTFDVSLFPERRLYRRFRGVGAIGSFNVDAMSEPMMLEEAPVMMAKSANMAEKESFSVQTDGAADEDSKTLQGSIAGLDVGSEEKVQEEALQLRENLQETAFFYPQLMTDDRGQVALKFTLPESLTTWRFIGLAHTKDMCCGVLTDKTVAQKDVMVQPNMPRFLRLGDKGTVSTRLFNTSGHAVSGKARIELLDPETEKVLYTATQPFSVEADATGSASFDIDTDMAALDGQTLLVCRVTAVGEGFSDGEQHYLPLLPNRERVTVSRPFTQNEPGTATIDLKQMVPADATGGELTVEYTNNPAWLIVQALPSMSVSIDENAVSQAAAYYANSLGKFIVKQIPNAQRTFELWQQEEGQETSLTSNLEKNQELKDILLNETPWVMEAVRETEQKHRLADFFDSNNLNTRTAAALEQLGKLQQGSGAWSWWEGMPGSFWMTVEISEMLVRLNAMAGTQSGTQSMLSRAFGYMQREIAEEVKRLKEHEKKYGSVSFPTYKALQYLYICALDGRKLPSDAQKDNEYLVNLLRKDIKQQDLYDKAVTAIILEKYDRKTCLEYVQSLKEYTVYNEEKGRYYDTHRASYSWFDYRIPTQVAAIEAIGRLTPDDQQTLQEMQRWLLQEKRTTAWDTPINSVNAIYAFLMGNKQSFGPQERTVLAIDGQPLELPKATAGLGYVKTRVPAKDTKTFIAEKKSEGVSWGAVYAQFMQHTGHISDSGSGITVRRELLKVDQNMATQPVSEPLKVGDRVRVVITIEAERDYDFVQVLDKRAACMEPVSQLSGYSYGVYCSPRDYSTNYYFDMLPKGKRVISTEYYIDRAGTYETGTCSVECAYAPEYRAKTKSVTLKIEE